MSTNLETMIYDQSGSARPLRLSRKTVRWERGDIEQWMHRQKAREAA